LLVGGDLSLPARIVPPLMFGGPVVWAAMLLYNQGRASFLL